MIKNKRGWIRILEAAAAVLIVAGALLYVIEKGYVGTDISKEIYETENSILKKIQLNDSLRNDVLNLPLASLPNVSNKPGFPSDVNKTIVDNTPIFLDCRGMICELNKTCSYDPGVEQDVYAKSIAIIATTDEQEFRQVKLFCWRK